MNEQIKAEARQRLILEEAKNKAELVSIREKEELKRKETEERIYAERIHLLAEEEQVRIKARRLAVEAEAKRLANEKEAAIVAEVERLRNRTKLEVLEDTVAELSAQLAELKSANFKSTINTANEKAERALIETQNMSKRLQIIVNYERDYADYIDKMFMMKNHYPVVPHMSGDEYKKNNIREKPILPTI